MLRVKDLKGKVVAGNAFGGAVDLAARSMVLKNGLRPNGDAWLSEANCASEGAMPREGKIQVAGLVQPFWAFIQRNGNVRPLFTQKDGLGTTQFLFFAAKEDVIAAKRDLLVKYLEDYVQGVQFVLDPKNRDRVIKVIARLNKESEDKFVDWALLKDRDYYHAPDGRINQEALQKNVDQLAELGQIRATFDVGPHADNSLPTKPPAPLRR